MDLGETWRFFRSKLQNAKPTSNGIEARCPAHDDKKASLTASLTEGNILLKCHAGCSFEDVVSSLGMDESAFFVQEEIARPKKITATYKYEDEKSNHVFSVVRFDPKDFRPLRPDGRFTLEGVTRVPYRLPQMLKAIEAQKTVLLVEGEKDCDNLAEIGLTATTFPGGAGKWRDDYLHWFKGSKIACLPDNDRPGKDGMHLLAKKISPVAQSILWLELPGIPDKGDISDWLKQEGNDLEKFKELAKEKATAWEAPTLKPEKKEPEQILHKDFYSPPGFVGELADFIVDNSKYRQPILALSASLAYAGVLMGRKVATEENTRSNLFIAALARTGHGKESARAIIKNLDAKLDLECFGAEKVTSRAAIERILSWRPSSLFMIDEFGLFMKAIMNENAPKYAIEVMTTFMEVYTSSGIYYGQDKASREEKRFEIDQPCCSIYGTSTPETFWSSLDSSKVRDGSMNRFTIFNAPHDRPERQRGKILKNFPTEIINKAMRFKNMSIQPGKLTGDMTEATGSPDPEVITYTDNAWRKFEDLEDYCTQMIDNSGVLGSMWVRTAEHAKKIALINCVGDDKSQITSEHADYGVELIKFLTESTCNEINRNLADNEYERISKRIERLIRDSHTKGISTTELYKATRFLRNGKHRKEVLEDLQTAGLIVCLKDEGSGAGRRSERWIATEAL
tara:strand:- start:1266 stop:3308 length:2043 start_codon:yes stop_codon:yes gene_type:complete